MTESGASPSKSTSPSKDERESTNMQNKLASIEAKLKAVRAKLNHISPGKTKR